MSDRKLDQTVAESREKSEKSRNVFVEIPQRCTGLVDMLYGRKTFDAKKAAVKCGALVVQRHRE